MQQHKRVWSGSSGMENNGKQIKLIHVLRIQKAAWGRELDGVHWCWCRWNFWTETRRKYVGLLETYMDLLSEKREQNNQERLGVPWPFRSHPNHGCWVVFWNFTPKVDHVVRRERLHAALAQLDAMPAMMNDLEKTSGLKGCWIPVGYVAISVKNPWIFSFLRNAPGRWRSCRKKRQSRRRRCHNCDSKPTKRAPTWGRARLDSGRFFIALFRFVSWSLFFEQRF